MSLSLVTSTEGTLQDRKEVTPRDLWALEIENADKAVENFHKRGDTAVIRFTDERDSVNADKHWFNIYYANTNILESALYANIPKPSVSRRYDDYRDSVARVAALILQRVLQTDLDDPEDQFNAVMQQCVQDRLVPGVGCAWLRLETEVDPIPTQEGGVVTDNAQSTQPHANVPPPAYKDGFDVPAMGPDGQPLQKIKDQRIVTDYVYWRDIRWSPCRVWSERRWVARRVFMTREQLTKRFGKAKADLCSLDYSEVKVDMTGGLQGLLSKEVFQKAVVWEIWDRVKREVVWYANGYPKELLDTRKDFLHLQSFEPCPEPMLANITTTSTVPRPDYYMIQDQYTELNSVNARISLLVQACKVVGVYDQGAHAALNGMLSGNENTMIPVPNWAQFSEKGGMKGAVDWLPLEMVVAALQRLYEAREAIKGQIYELTGIADIVRGDSKASETLGAQKIKAQFASIRIKKLQNEVARFASDILRIKAEIAVKHFTPETLIRKSGIVYTDNDEFVVDAIALLKSEEGFNWRVEVQADSMAQADYEAEKEDRVKFMSMVTGYLTQALPIAGQIPEMKPVILGMLKWGIASFKGADDIEGMIDKQLTMLEGKPPEQPKPDPKVQALQMRGQIDQQKAQQDSQIKQQDAQLSVQESQQKMQIDQQKAQGDMALKRQQMMLDKEMHDQDMAFEREKMELERQKAGIDLQTTITKGQIDMQTHQATAAQKVEDAMVQSDLNRQKGEQALEQSAASHEQQLKQAKDLK